MNVVIAGGRDFINTTLVFNKLKNLLNTNDVIISGHASGADKIGEAYARVYHMQVKLFPAEWDKYGACAGFKRNIEMVDKCDYCLILWDGQSRGTKHDIILCQSKNKPHKIIVYNNPRKII
jgi:hypothetical protein